MNISSLQYWIGHPEELNKSTLYELRTALARYPYCQSLRLLYLKNLYLLRDETFGGELRKSVFYLTDRRVLFYLIEGDKFLFPKQRQQQHETKEQNILEVEEPSIDRTLSLIDAFLSETPTDDSQRISLDYSMDYMAYMLNESDNSPEKQMEAPELRGQALIDKFILESENEQSFKPRAVEQYDAGVNNNSHEETDAEDTCFTETLAKIYVKQHRYDKALEIIKKLSLKYPKKNIYFADQVRFLEKLIINAKS